MKTSILYLNLIIVRFSPYSIFVSKYSIKGSVKRWKNLLTVKIIINLQTKTRIQVTWHPIQNYLSGPYQWYRSKAENIQCMEFISFNFFKLEELCSLLFECTSKRQKHIKSLKIFHCSVYEIHRFLILCYVFHMHFWEWLHPELWRFLYFLSLCLHQESLSTAHPTPFLLVSDNLSYLFRPIRLGWG